MEPAAVETIGNRRYSPHSARVLCVQSTNGQGSKAINHLTIFVAFPLPFAMLSDANLTKARVALSFGPLLQKDSIERTSLLPSQILVAR